MNLTSKLLHGVVKGPLIVDTEGVDQTVVEGWCYAGIQADGFVSVWGRNALSAVDPKAEINAQTTGQTVTPMKVAEKVFNAAFREGRRG